VQRRFRLGEQLLLAGGRLLLLQQFVKKRRLLFGRYKNRPPLLFGFALKFLHGICGGKWAPMECFAFRSWLATDDLSGFVHAAGMSKNQIHSSTGRREERKPQVFFKARQGCMGFVILAPPDLRHEGQVRSGFRHGRTSKPHRPPQARPGNTIVEGKRITSR